MYKIRITMTLFFNAALIVANHGLLGKCRNVILVVVIIMFSFEFIMIGFEN